MFEAHNYTITKFEGQPQILEYNLSLEGQMSSVFTKKVHSNTHEADPQYNQIATFRESYLQSLARTVYPYVPEIYGVTMDTITMEEIIGLRLDTYLLTGGYRYLRRILTMLRTLLDQIHSIGLIHNDLHLSNLIVDNKGNLYVIDFGNSFLIRMMPDILFADKFQLQAVDEPIVLERDDFIYIDLARTLFIFMDNHLETLYESPRELGLDQYPPTPVQYIDQYRRRIVPIFSGGEMTLADYKHVVAIFADIFES